MARSKKKFKAFGYEFRSKLEYNVALDLHERGVDFEYETVRFKWNERLPRAICESCGKGLCFVERSYTPDFILPNGIILEVKGRFTSKDRKIQMAMKEQHPDIDIRMVFQRDNKLNRNSSTKYSDWCESREINYCVGRIPELWLE